MAVKWSWSFGAETAEELETAGWDPQSTNVAHITEDNSRIYTYVGSPSRYSLNMRRGYQIAAPPGVVSPSGWVAVAFYCNDVFDQWYQDRHIIMIKDDRGKAISIYCDNNATQTVKLKVGDTNDPAGAFTVSQNDWHYIALQYDMTSSVWSARWYLDGVAMGTLTSDASEEATTAQELRLSVAGISDADALGTWYGQIIAWDDKLGDAGEISKFATRIQPGIDTAEGGVWNPSTGATNWEVLSGTMATGTYTEIAGAVVGNYVTCQASTGAGVDISDMVGVIPTSIHGVTCHGLVSGSGPYGKVSLGDDNSNWVTGTNVLPAIADPKYAFATAPSQSSGGVWTSASTVYLKYEVS